MNNLIKPNERVVVALSGGVDSSVLFYTLKNMGYDVIVAHVNHKKRVE
ncbi:MAG: 7-cyano-7-deazaguanine synthase, partial [Acholeplasmatales bacterium]|nr:7-cyano-7-deazaguanine synthase [Acholeplasmatales bacterium]